MSEVIGVKHDGGKPWAGTVLAGFWPQLRLAFGAEMGRHSSSDEDVADIETVSDALDALFDVSIAVPDRLVNAAKCLTTSVRPAAYLPHVIDVGTYGARKYARDNWLHVEGGVERYYEAAGRHVRDVMLGDWRDEESGCVNLGHIAWGILAGAELVRRSDKPVILNADHETMQALGLHNPSGVSLGPALKLPLEVGKRYKLTCPHIPLDEGVFFAETYNSSAVALGDGWLFNVATGEALAGEQFRLEGPVSP